MDLSLRSADVFPVVASITPKIVFGGREATTGNKSALRRLGGFPLSRNFSVCMTRVNEIETMNVNEWSRIRKS